MMRLEKVILSLAALALLASCGKKAPPGAPAPPRPPEAASVDAPRPPAGTPPAAAVRTGLTSARMALPPARELQYLSAWSYLDDLDAGTPAGDLAVEIDSALAKTPPGRMQRDLATLRVRLDYAAQLARGAGSVSEAELESRRQRLSRILAGEESLAHEGGLRGYWAANDSSCQPFRVSLPAGYDPAGRYPLVIHLHHHGWTDWHQPFQCSAPALDGAIVAGPHGRGSCDYMWLAEDDVLAVIDACLADFAADPERVYVTGWSMGGTGSFHLPARYPDRFAAAWAVAGNADFTAWEQEWKEDRRRVESPRSDVRMLLRWRTAPVTWAENFLNVAIAFDHGLYDSINPVGHSKAMAGRFTQLGYSGARFRFGEGGHGWGASLDERFNWMKGFSLNARPPRVRLKTDGYRHGGAYWVELARLESRMKNAFIDIEVVSPAEISLHAAEGVERMRLDLRGLELVRDVARLTWGEGATRRGIDLPEPTPDSVELIRSGAGWAVYSSPPPGREPQWPPSKRLGLEGPIYDCFREPFLLVVGTTAKDGRYRRVVREEAGRLARNWRSRFQCWPPVKDDSEVTEEDICSRSLVLFGGPGENSVAARALATGKLPVSFGEGSVTLNGKTFAGDDLGVKLCYPNPLAPDRMLVLFAAADFAGMWQSVHRFGNWFDWMPLSNLEWYDWCVFDSKTQELETMLDVGFFDEDWRPSDALRWGPVESWRARAEPRILPKHDALPKGDTVCLSELWPESIDTLRGNVRIDRSMNGGPLCIGRTPQPFGLGVWIESAVTYDLDGAFRRFTVDFGIDAEGQETTSAARAETERTVFEVLADGRELARRTGVTFGEAPGSFDLDVTGVRRLTLRALRSSPKGWLYGPVCWGSPTLHR